MSNDIEPESDDETELEEPIKIRWTGYARGRIGGYNADFSTERSDHVQNTLNRQKTNVVIYTVEEAEALMRELNEYDSSQRVWMNASMDNALERVRTEIIEAMHERDYAAKWNHRQFGRTLDEFADADELDAERDDADELDAERDDVICGECHGANLERTDKEQDGIAWWLSYRCDDCGATGRVENRHTNGSKYHGSVTTPRRVDLRREAAYARDRERARRSNGGGDR